MRTLEESRKYEVLVDGAWIPVHWEQLDKGDTVRCNPALPEDVYHDASPFVVDEQPTLMSTENLEVVMKAQLMMDEDVITIEDLMERYKISVAYVPGVDGALPIWTADVFENGVSKASSAGHTLRDAVEILVNFLD